MISGRCLCGRIRYEVRGTPFHETLCHCDDCRRDYGELKAKGVEFTEEPTERFYGIDCGFRDPFGNKIRLTQLAPDPIEMPDKASM